MKAIILGLSVLMMSGATFAEEPKSSQTPEKGAVTEITKKTRKKKVEMCAECGKPESECECHKDEKKKEVKKDEAKKG